MRNNYLLYVSSFLALWLCLGISAWAQERTVTGTVTGEGDALPGVNVLLQGTTTGTVTDIDGKYSIQVTGNNPVLSFSSIGFTSQNVEVGNRSVVDVSLEVDVQQLGEVVVTALGIEKEKKALGYSVTELQGEDFVQAREVNLGDALAGKVAGVNVSNIGSGVAGSSRVIIRGNTSLAGNNQPLYIIDGVPIDNTQMGAAGMWGGQDWGDGLNSLNPDDIASISVLKGNTAAALYGSRASNGVIVITTKKGTARKGIGVEINSNFTVENYVNTYDFQNEYGHGTRIEKPSTVDEALDNGGSGWGAKLDGSPVVQFDGEQRPYSYSGDNFDKYYRTGSTLTNTIALTGGSDKQTFRFSASDLRQEAITPNSGMNRQNLTLSTNANWVEKLTLSAKVQYVREDVNNRARLSDAPGNGNYTLSVLPPSINVNDLRGTTPKLGALEDGTELPYSSNTFSQNPWWAAYQFDTDDIRNRIITSNMLRYDITDWLYVHGRIGLDWYNTRRTAIEPFGTRYKPRGSITELNRTISEVNMEFMVGADKTFGEFGLNAFFGGNRMKRSDETLGGNANNFNIPFFHTLSNGANQSVTYGLSEKGINSLYGSVELSYGNFIFLSATGRNDWFSTLNPESNSIFYPSIGGSFVFSDATEMPSWLSFGKVRASWAQVGGDTDPYQTALTYQLVGQGHLGAALERIAQGSIPNPDLKPLTVSETEVGFDVRLFDNRLGIDYAYYTRKTEDDILNASVSQSTGYGSATVNVGELTNQGHELLITATPITGALRWDVTFNFAYNKNEVKQLVGDQKVFQAQEARSRNAFAQHRIEYVDEEGNLVQGGYSAIVGYTHKMIDGQLVYTEDGYPVQSDDLRVLGFGVHPYTTGLTNTFAWRGFNLSFLVDMKFGGDLYSGTNASTVGSGMHKMTLQGRDGEGITVSGVDEEGVANTWTIAPENLQDYWGRYNDIADYFVEDASFIKLRQFTFGYNFPGTLLERTPFTSASLSVVGRNLWLIHSNVDNVDPESTYNASNGQGLEWFGVPQTRSFGVNLNLKF